MPLYDNYRCPRRYPSAQTQTIRRLQNILLHRMLVCCPLWFHLCSSAMQNSLCVHRFYAAYRSLPSSKDNQILSFCSSEHKSSCHKTFPLNAHRRYPQYKYKPYRRLPDCRDVRHRFHETVFPMSIRLFCLFRPQSSHIP